MADDCSHLDTLSKVKPSARGCEECLRTGSRWVHLRICRTCGHVGCCDQSPNRHATKHFHATKHPLIEGYDPPEDAGWLVGARAVQGLAAAVMTPASLALLGASFARHERARAFGIWAGAGALTTACGPALGGWLVDIAGWRSIFLVNLPLAGIAVA